MSPRPIRDLDERIYRTLALGGRWTCHQVSVQVNTVKTNVYRSFNRLRAQGLAQRFQAGAMAGQWVAIDPRGVKIEDVEKIINGKERNDPWKSKAATVR